VLFSILAVFGFLAAALLLVLALFEPPLPYRMSARPDVPTDSAEFSHLLAIVADAHLHNDSAFEVLTNGERLYEAELAAIRSARSHVCLEAYIFQKGEIAARFIDALAERARAGIEVRLVLDAVGSFNTGRRTFRELIEAGGDVRW
jgi:cardiolipin synthase